MSVPGVKLQMKGKKTGKEDRETKPAIRRI
jgi:hypothetical protein